MSTTASVAIYAAVIATAGLAWQIYTWFRAHRTRVRVTMSNAVFGFPQGPEAGVTIDARNDCGHPIRVKSAGFTMNDGSNGHVVIVRPGVGSSLPGVIPPHDSGMIWMHEDEMRQAGLDVYKPLVGWVSTSTGETFTTKPVTLRTP